MRDWAIRKGACPLNDDRLKNPEDSNTGYHLARPITTKKKSEDRASVSDDLKMDSSFKRMRVSSGDRDATKPQKLKVGEKCQIHG